MAIKQRKVETMGAYLNGIQPYTLYKRVAQSKYFVDKSAILGELIPLIDSDTNYICITRPRRFGKTVMANMIASFFSKGKEAASIFASLKVANQEGYQDYLNRHNLVSIPFNEIPKDCASYKQYISRIEKRLLRDLQRAYPDCCFRDDEAVWDAFNDIFSEYQEEKFIFVMDEWDFIFHRDFVTEDDKKAFISFLSNLLKDKAYVSLAYMTGILPIAKYSSGSELNMFSEFTMAGSPAFSDYFGFTETEVDGLYQHYIENCPTPTIQRDGLRLWYNGYHTASGERVYNPRSIVQAFRFNNLAGYWTSSGPYDEIFYYIKNNVADVRDDLALMVAGEAVPARIQEYAATSMKLLTKDEIFSAMIVYGFLSCEDGKVSIPNKELMDRFSDMIKKERSLGYLYQLARESDRMLAATLNGDTDTMAELLAYAHNTEIPLQHYNDETELSAIVNLVYLSARDAYDIQREDKGGIGYVDFIFYPKKYDGDCIILELKIDHTPEAAIQQIKDKAYALRFRGKLGEASVYTGRILAVGIAYDRKSKRHCCGVEVL